MVSNPTTLLTTMPWVSWIVTKRLYEWVIALFLMEPSALPAWCQCTG